MFSKWEKHIKIQFLEEVEECLQHNDLGNYLHCCMVGEGMTMNVLMSSYYHFNTDHCEAIK